MTDLQVLTADNHLHLLRKAGNAYKVVTSQTDWPTYNGDYSGRRFSDLDQINQSNVDLLKIEWIYRITGIGPQRAELLAQKALALPINR